MHTPSLRASFGRRSSEAGPRGPSSPPRAAAGVQGPAAVPADPATGLDHFPLLQAVPLTPCPTLVRADLDGPLPVAELHPASKRDVAAAEQAVAAAIQLRLHQRHHPTAHAGDVATPAPPHPVPTGPSAALPSSTTPLQPPNSAGPASPPQADQPVAALQPPQAPHLEGLKAPALGSDNGPDGGLVGTDSLRTLPVWGSEAAVDAPPSAAAAPEGYASPGIEAGIVLGGGEAGDSGGGGGSGEAGSSALAAEARGVAEDAESGACKPAGSSGANAMLPLAFGSSVTVSAPLLKLNPAFNPIAAATSATAATGPSGSLPNSRPSSAQPGTVSLSRAASGGEGAASPPQPLHSHGGISGSASGNAFSSPSSAARRAAAVAAAAAGHGWTSSEDSEFTIARLHSWNCSTAANVISAIPPPRRKPVIEHQSSSNVVGGFEHTRHAATSTGIGSLGSLTRSSGHRFRGGGGGGAAPTAAAPGGAASSAAVERYGALMMSSAGWRCTEIMHDMHDALLMTRMTGRPGPPPPAPPPPAVSVPVYDRRRSASGLGAGTAPTSPASPGVHPLGRHRFSEVQPTASETTSPLQPPPRPTFGAAPSISTSPVASGSLFGPGSTAAGPHSSPAVPGGGGGGGGGVYGGPQGLPRASGSGGAPTDVDAASAAAGSGAGASQLPRASGSGRGDPNSGSATVRLPSMPSLALDRSAHLDAQGPGGDGPIPSPGPRSGPRSGPGSGPFLNLGPAACDALESAARSPSASCALERPTGLQSPPVGATPHSPTPHSPTPGRAVTGRGGVLQSFLGPITRLRSGSSTNGARAAAAAARASSDVPRRPPASPSVPHFAAVEYGSPSSPPPSALVAADPSLIHNASNGIMGMGVGGTLSWEATLEVLREQVAPRLPAAAPGPGGGGGGHGGGSGSGGGGGGGAPLSPRTKAPKPAAGSGSMLKLFRRGSGAAGGKGSRQRPEEGDIVGPDTGVVTLALCPDGPSEHGNQNFTAASAEALAIAYAAAAGSVAGGGGGGGSSGATAEPALSTGGGSGEFGTLADVLGSGRLGGMPRRAPPPSAPLASGTFNWNPNGEIDAAAPPRGSSVSGAPLPPALESSLSALAAATTSPAAAVGTSKLAVRSSPLHSPPIGVGASPTAAAAAAAATSGRVSPQLPSGRASPTPSAADPWLRRAVQEDPTRAQRPAGWRPSSSDSGTGPGPDAIYVAANAAASPARLGGAGSGGSSSGGPVAFLVSGSPAAALAPPPSAPSPRITLTHSLLDPQIVREDDGEGEADADGAASGGVGVATSDIAAPDAAAAAAVAAGLASPTTPGKGKHQIKSLLRSLVSRSARHGGAGGGGSTGGSASGSNTASFSGSSAAASPPAAGAVGVRTASAFAAVSAGPDSSGNSAGNSPLAGARKGGSFLGSLLRPKSHRASFDSETFPAAPPGGSRSFALGSGATAAAHRPLVTAASGGIGGIGVGGGGAAAAAAAAAAFLPPSRHSVDVAAGAAVAANVPQRGALAAAMAMGQLGRPLTAAEAEMRLTHIAPLAAAVLSPPRKH